MLETADIPVFPDFADLEKNHQRLLGRKLNKVQPQISEMSFDYLWSWKPYVKTVLSRLGDELVFIMNNTRSGETVALPPAACNIDKAAALIPEILERGDVAAVVRVPGGCAEAVRKRSGGGLNVAEERDRADYVYESSQLHNLPGRPFHSKRNHIKQFQSSRPDAKYRPLDGALAAECIDFSRCWLEEHPKKHLPGLQKEVDICVRMLENFDWLKLRGGAVTERGQVLAFALGGALNDDTFVIRVEKASPDVPGGYQYINREFVRNAASGYKWINREQDLGLPGLRRAKQSYCPHHLVRKYRITV